MDVINHKTNEIVEFKGIIRINIQISTQRQRYSLLKFS